MTWLKAHLVPLLVGLAVLMAVGTVSGWVSSARYKGMAEAHETQADNERERADSIETARLIAERADSIRYYALRDSAVMREVRAEAARREEALARERAQRARARALAAAESLEETLLPAQVPLFDAYKRERDTEARELRTEIESKEQRLEEVDSENASLWEARESIASLYDQAIEENRALRGANESLRVANEALRRASRSTSIFPDFGAITKPLYFAIGAAVGYGIAEVR